MSKVLFFGAAAIGGAAFLAFVSRYSFSHSVSDAGMAGGDDGNACNENQCGPKTGEVLKGESELTATDEQWRNKLTPEQFNVTRRKGTFVLEAKPAFKVLAHNQLASDTSDFNAAPAIVHGRLLIRSNRCLYCIGAK